MLTAIAIALLIYFLVAYRLPIRVPYPGIQAGVDLLKAADLSDGEVRRMAVHYINHTDRRHPSLGADHPLTLRLERLTGHLATVGGVALNFKVYKSSAINAFATADGSIRIFSGLMEVMSDEELMAIVGHEMGHIRNQDSLRAMRKSLLTSAARGVFGAMGGGLGALTASQLGSWAEHYVGAQFSQKQEFGADDFSFGFLVRQGYNPAAMGLALEKLCRISRKGGTFAQELQQLFSTHPDPARRALRIKDRAQTHPHLTSQIC